MLPRNRLKARVAVAFLLFSARAAAPQGNPLGPEFRINTYTSNGQVEPSIAADSSGNYVVVWQGASGSIYPQVWGQRYAASGTPLGAEFRVNTFTDLLHFNPSVAADPVGNFVVVFEYATLNPSGLAGQRYAGSGAPLGGQFAVAGGPSYVPAIATDLAGNFVVAWEALSDAPGSLAVFARRFTNTGVPSPAFRVNTYTTGHQRGASVAAAAAGNFVVVWTSGAQDGSLYGVFGQRYDAAGAPLGSEFRVNSYTVGSQASPAVAGDSAGNFVVVWTSAAQDGSSYGIFAQRYASSGAPLGVEFRVNAFTTGNQWAPMVAADASGNFVVTWTSAAQDGSGNGIFAQRFDAAGSPLGPEFKVNTYTSGAQLTPTVAADISGDFVVAWTSAGQDGSGYGIFGQRYNQILPVELLGFGVE